jgi:hypothetical protein
LYNKKRIELPSQPPQRGSFEFIEAQLHAIEQPLEKGLAFERLCVKYLISATFLSIQDTYAY